jgi:hypothetical protein
MAKKKDGRWWEGMEPIHKGCDGVEVTHVYARSIGMLDGAWEYAIVRYKDDGTFLGVALLRNGRLQSQGQPGF